MYYIILYHLHFTFPGTTINGAVLHITEDMVSTTSWECTAANNVRGNSSQKTTRVDIKTGI